MKAQTVRDVRPVPGRRHRVSVVIPSYNYARYLRSCAESALTQAGVDVEVLIVDNASEDGSQAIASELAAADPRVSTVFHPRNLGHVASFNEGLSAASGEFVVLLCADDMLPPGSLARAVALFEAYPSVGLVYGRPVEFGDDRPAASGLPLKGWTIWSGREWLALRCRRGMNCIRHPEVMMRTSALRQIGGFRPELPHTCDFEMWMRLASVADVGHVDGPDQGWYRIHPGSLRHTSYSESLTELRHLRDAFAWTFKGPGSAVPGAERLHNSARRVLAGRALENAGRAYDRGPADRWAPWGRRREAAAQSVVPVDELVEFARDIWPDAEHLPQWRRLARRSRLSRRRTQLMPPFVLTGAIHRASNEIHALRWRRHGI